MRARLPIVSKILRSTTHHGQHRQHRGEESRERGHCVDGVGGKAGDFGGKAKNKKLESDFSLALGRSTQRPTQTEIITSIKTGTTD
jgi:hypothetical protein